MATSKNQLQSFQKNWNTTAAWAHSQGIKYDSYYPVYQMDSKRLIQYGTQMSQAERERAILAAGNPNGVQQATPSTAHSPFNIVGNTITDLRNIFTGVGDIVIHPLHNGLVDSVKNTFDLLDGSHHLTGGSALADLGQVMTDTVASWIPGMMDVGTVLQAKNPVLGFESLMEHPVQSLLDLSPLSKMAGTSMLKDASLAKRAGVTPEQAAKGMTLGRLGKNYLMNTPTKEMGPRGIMTFGDKLYAKMGSSFINSNPGIADAMLTLSKDETHYTLEQRMLFADAHAAYDVLSPDQKEQLHEIIDPSVIKVDPSAKKNNSTPWTRMEDPKYDQAARDAARAFLTGPGRFIREEQLISGDITKLIDPKTGQERLYSAKGHADVIKAGVVRAATTKIIINMFPQFEKWAEQTSQAEQLIVKHTDALEEARVAAAKVDVGILNYTQKLPGSKALVGISHQGIAGRMFNEGGIIDSIVQHAKDGKWQDVLELSKIAQKRMESWGVRNVDAAADPHFKAVLQQVGNLHLAANISIQLRKRVDNAVYGKGEEWAGTKGVRDAQMKAEVDALEQRYKDMDVGVKRHLTAQKGIVDNAIKAKARSIRTKADEAIATQREWTRAQHAAINEAWHLQKRKTFLGHISAAENARAKMALMRREIRAGRLEGPSIPADTVGQLEQGLGIMPGSIGTKEGIDAELVNLEAKRTADLARHEAAWKQAGYIKDEATIKAEMRTELAQLEVVKMKMKKDLEGAMKKDRQRIEVQHKSDARALEAANKGKRSRDGVFSVALKANTDATKAFAKAVWENPPDVFTDVYFDTFAKHLMKTEAGRELMGRADKILGKPEERIAELRSNPNVLRDLVQLASKGVFTEYGFSPVDQEIIDSVTESAKNEVRRLAENPKIQIAYVPHISSLQQRAEETGSYGIHITVGHGIPSVDSAMNRVWDMDRSRFDIMASFNHGGKQILDRDATVDYVTNFLAPRTVTTTALYERIVEAHPEVSRLTGESLTSYLEAKARDWGMVKFDPEGMFGFTMPRWDKAGDLYLDGDLVKAIKKVQSRQASAIPIYDKVTRLFRYSILGLSPRYTAHILFGGSFLLALRSSPAALGLIRDAYEMIKNGQTPEGLGSAATQLGTTEWELRDLKSASNRFHEQGGRDGVRLVAQEHIEITQGIKLAAAKPIHWLKALADINLRFTSYVTNMQKAIAYLDGAAKAEKIEGMTPKRAMAEGMHHANEVMGDLRRMSPMERTMAASVMPFYGWTKHILTYVLSFPGDHPWRAMMLANMAEFDLTHQDAGLPSRYKFLFFLGSPDKQGNVTALDFRALNPLRDVANYATLGGVISALNPVITAGFAMVDPQIMFGANTLYPNLTYDQFYGIEAAGPQGNLMTAAQGIVPQLSAIKSAMGIAGARQGMSTDALVKNIYASLNIPMFQPQQINLKQEAARTAMARYQVSKSLAANAWSTGDFAPIANLGSVPDPRNPDYETPVSDLQALYAQLAADYPGQDPAAVAKELPAYKL